MKNPAAALQELSSEQLAIARQNLERSLRALDQRGEVGLQAGSDLSDEYRPDKRGAGAPDPRQQDADAA